MNRAHRTVTWIGAGLVLAAAIGVAVAFLSGLRGPSKLESAAQAPSGKAPASADANADRPVQVKVVRPKREHLRRVSTPQPAHVAPYEKTDIQAKVAGYLEMVGPALGPDGKPIMEKDGKPRPLDIGDRVTKGQKLAELSIPEMKQELARKAALVEKARADLGQATAAVAAADAMAAAANAKIDEIASLVAKHDADVIYRKVEYERYLGLYKRSRIEEALVDKELNHLRAAEATLAAAKSAVVTAQANAKVEQAKLIQARADEKAATARIKVAQADLRYTEIMVDYATIRAPYDGILTRRLVDPGDFIQSATTAKATPLFTVARVDRLRIVAEIPEAEAGLVRIGQPAGFHMNATRGQPLTGKVVRFADALDPGTRTMRVEVEVDAPRTTLRPGMFGSGTIVLVDIPDALTLPASALAAGKAPCVLCVQDGRVQRREIEIGYDDGVRMQITRGLLADAQVIADARAPVREGQTVEVAK